MFIAFEGLDGSGSSTQSRYLTERLEKNGYATHLTKEPTSNTHIGKMIREILQHKWKISPEGFQLLFSADRAEHLKNEIQPALNNGQIVITDRYLFSTIAYGALDVDFDWLVEISKNFPIPDITFLNKIDPSECIKRISGRGGDAELFEKHDKLTKVWENYEKLLDMYTNIHVIDTNKSIEECDDEIWEIISEKLDKL